LDYVPVAGFIVPEPAILLAADDEVLRVQTLPFEYTQSLLEWFSERARFGGSQ